MITTERLQLILRVADRAMAHQRAIDDLAEAQRRLDQGYADFFEAHGRPEGRFHQDNEDFLPVMFFTEGQYQRLQAAKKAEYNALRRHHTALRALESFNPVDLKGVA
ncbi:hypothetical protein [Pseudomonas sp. RL_105y_Pfl2_101]|uniref:hypothetical protein n=1 Tax=Pseudomonas sp. RL_105y_Pfl2_101 TaxID=3088708 RepID=UPI0030DD6C84